MNLVPSFSWWARLRRARFGFAATPDFGDMGTAFGLDASLDPQPPQKPAGPTKKGHAETGVPPQRRTRINARAGR